MGGFADDENWFDPMCEHGVSKTNEICHECEKGAEEFRQLSPLSLELQAAAVEFLRQATKNSCSFVGMLIRVDDPPLMSVIGNVIQTGSEVARLFRMYADLIEERGDVIQIDVTPRK